MRPGLAIVTTWRISRLARLRWNRLSLYPVFWNLNITLKMFDDILSLLNRHILDDLLAWFNHDLLFIAWLNQNLFFNNMAFIFLGTLLLPNNGDDDTDTAADDETSDHAAASTTSSAVVDRSAVGSVVSDPDNLGLSLSILGVVSGLLGIFIQAEVSSAAIGAALRFSTTQLSVIEAENSLSDDGLLVVAGSNSADLFTSWRAVSSDVSSVLIAVATAWSIGVISWIIDSWSALLGDWLLHNNDCSWLLVHTLDAILIVHLPILVVHIRTVHSLITRDNNDLLARSLVDNRWSINIGLWSHVV